MKYPARPCTFDADCDYDLAVFTVGYERRSSYLWRMGLRGRESMGFAFNAQRVFSTDENLALAISGGATVLERPPGADLSADLVTAVGQVSGSRALRVAVDISSMTRRRLASVLLTADALADSGRPVQVDFFYCPAEYQPADPSPSSAMEAGPVLPEFAGRLRSVSLPVGAVIGLGYEPQRALGAFELLEPSRAWSFRPYGGPERYGTDVLSANRPLLEILGSEAVFDYDVSAGADLLYALDSFVFALESEYRLVLIPMGPKIFALSCLLLGLGSDRSRPAVWRIGERVYDTARDVREDGSIVGIRVDMGT